MCGTHEFLAITWNQSLQSSRKMSQPTASTRGIELSKWELLRHPLPSNIDSSLYNKQCTSSLQLNPLNAENPAVYDWDLSWSLLREDICILHFKWQFGPIKESSKWERSGNTEVSIQIHNNQWNLSSCHLDCHCYWRNQKFEGSAIYIIEVIL